MNQFPITRLYTGADGNSYFENQQIQLSLSTLIGQLSQEIPTRMIQFRYTEPSYDLELHNAPRKQFIIMIEGGVQITTSKGETRIFEAGSKERSVLLVEDVDGFGHYSKALDGKGRYSIFVGLE